MRLEVSQVPLTLIYLCNKVAPTELQAVCEHEQLFSENWHESSTCYECIRAVCLVGSFPLLPDRQRYPQGPNSLKSIYNFTIHASVQSNNCKICFTLCKQNVWICGSNVNQWQTYYCVIVHHSLLLIIVCSLFKWYLFWIMGGWHKSSASHYLMVNRFHISKLILGIPKDQHDGLFTTEAATQKHTWQEERE